MISALVACPDASGTASLSADLEAAGIRVLAHAEPGALVPAAVRHAPDVVVCMAPHPDDALFASTATLSNTAALPVVVFTTDPDAAKIEQATRSGIHAYVVNGYATHRLRSVVQVAQARFQHERALQGQLSDLNQRFDERKYVDRAKGILMRARQISEDDAFRLLRNAAMHSNQRVGEVSRQVIDAARYAEAVNRAGQLRMLSQRLVMLSAWRRANVAPGAADDAFESAFERTEDNLATLQRSLSLPTYGDLLDAVLSAWRRLRTLLRQSPENERRLAEIDACADDLLAAAERLTTTLETTGPAGSLRVINVAGRQRMLSQRLAKLALLGPLLEPPEAQAAARAAAATRTAFVQGLEFLQGIPLSTREIRTELDAAGTTWKMLDAALGRCGSGAGQADVARCADLLLGQFDRLTDHCERSMQTLMG